MHVMMAEAYKQNTTMNILQLSQAAQDYYDSLKAKSLVHGWEKYVATDGSHCLFVRNDYEPSENEAVFYCVVRNRNTMCQLHKVGQIRSSEPYTLSSSTNSMWAVTDNHNGISIVFREGLYNESQQVLIPTNLSPNAKARMATIMREMGEWIVTNYTYVAQCNSIEARISAIRKLDQEDWWMTIAAAFNGVWMPGDFRIPIPVQSVLAMEVHDFLAEQNPCCLSEEDKSRLLYLINASEDEESDEEECLSAAEAYEVISIVLSYWVTDKDIHTWARDILWWPAWANNTKNK